jgi:hypothetical protein
LVLLSQRFIDEANKKKATCPQTSGIQGIEADSITCLFSLRHKPPACDHADQRKKDKTNLTCGLISADAIEYKPCGKVAAKPGADEHTDDAQKKANNQ